MNNQQAYCTTHGSNWNKKYVGKDQWGNFFDVCFQGYKERIRGDKPTCKIEIEEVNK